MRQLGLRWLIALAWAVPLACRSPTPPATAIPVEEIEGPVAPPGPHVVDAQGKPSLGADPHELRAAGDYHYRAGELVRAHEFYAACSGAADGQLRAACLWAIGATLVAAARQQADEDLAHQQQLGLRPDHPSLRGCTPASEGFRHALSLLRIAHRSHPTARRAQVIAALHEQLGSQAEDPSCRHPDCPADLPFGWHRRDGEHEVLGSGLEGSARERIFACFGDPASFSSDIWIYWRASCNEGVVTTVRLHFDHDEVVRVTHERRPSARECGLQVD